MLFKNLLNFIFILGFVILSISPGNVTGYVAFWAHTEVILLMSFKSNDPNPMSSFEITEINGVDRWVGKFCGAATYYLRSDDSPSYHYTLSYKIINVRRSDYKFGISCNFGKDLFMPRFPGWMFVQVGVYLVSRSVFWDAILNPICDSISGQLNFDDTFANKDGFQLYVLENLDDIGNMGILLWEINLCTLANTSVDFKKQRSSNIVHLILFTNKGGVWRTTSDPSIKEPKQMDVYKELVGKVV
jgi:hypothetical protein